MKLGTYSIPLYYKKNCLISLLGTHRFYTETIIFKICIYGINFKTLKKNERYLIKISKLIHFRTQQPIAKILEKTPHRIIGDHSSRWKIQPMTRTTKKTLTKLLRKHQTRLVMTIRLVKATNMTAMTNNLFDEWPEKREKRKPTRTPTAATHHGKFLEDRAPPVVY